MADEDYVIRARIITTNEVDTAAGAAEKRLERVERRGLEVGQRISGALAAIGGVYAIGRALSGITELNDQLDVARIGVASLFQSATGNSFADSMKLARSELALLRKDAAGGVGELDDYLAGYRGILGKTLSAGFGADTARQLVRQSLAAGAATGSDLKLVSGDLRQALTSGAGDRTTPVVMQALDALGVSSESFNKMDTAKRIQTLTDAFGQYDDASAAFGKTFGAQADTMKDAVKDFIMTASRPIFDRWAEQLRKANEWLEKNEAVVARMADGAGKTLLAVYDSLPQIASGLAGIAAVRGAKSAATSVSGLVSGARMLGATGPQGMLASAGIAAAVAGASATLLASFKAYPETFTMVTREASESMQSLGRLAETLSGLSSKGSLFADIGRGVAYVISGIMDVFQKALAGLGAIAVGVDYAYQSLVELAVRDLMWMTGRQSMTDAYADSRGRQDQLKQSAYLSLATLTGGRNANGLEDGAAGDLPTTSNVVNIGKVEVKVDTEANADPARIAVVWDELLGKAVRTARQARRPTTPLGAY